MWQGMGRMQQVLFGEATSGLHDGAILTLEAATNICLRGAWDARKARFRPCFLPVIVGIPAAIAALILFCQILRLVITWRPRWTRPFVEEYVKPAFEELSLIHI